MIITKLTPYADIEAYVRSLEAEVTRLKNPTVRTVPNDFIVMHNTFKAVPITLAKFAKVEEPTSEEDFMTIAEYSEVKNVPLICSADGEFFALPFEMEELKNDYKGIKEGIQNPELKDYFGGVQPALGGDDFTQSENHLVWILSYSLFKEYRSINPHWQVVEDEAI